jgi:hypothetical protein
MLVVLLSTEDFEMMLVVKVSLFFLVKILYLAMMDYMVLMPLSSLSK